MHLKRCNQADSWINESVPKEEVWVVDMSLGVINLYMTFKASKVSGT